MWREICRCEIAQFTEARRVPAPGADPDLYLTTYKRIMGPILVERRRASRAAIASNIESVAGGKQLHLLAGAGAGVRPAPARGPRLGPRPHPVQPAQPVHEIMVDGEPPEDGGGAAGGGAAAAEDADGDAQAAGRDDDESSDDDEKDE